jgi:hypothetical protein
MMVSGSPTPDSSGFSILDCRFSQIPPVQRAVQPEPNEEAFCEDGLPIVTADEECISPKEDRCPPTIGVTKCLSCDRIGIRIRRPASNLLTGFSCREASAIRISAQ